MPTIDAYAKERHHAEHIAPIWLALKPAYRGQFIVKPGVAPDLAKLDLPGLVEGGPGGGPVPMLTSASGALLGASRDGRQHLAIMEHGCGQSFGGDTSFFGRVAASNPSYAGGDKRPAELFLFPGEHPAARERAARPDAQVEVIGSPRLDSLPARVPDGIPTVAFSFHWDTSLAPETRSTFIFYREHLKELARRGTVRILGHGHPRIFERLAPWYERQGIEPVRDFDEVCRRADAYACDGVSTLYEFASTGRPVIVLNAPFYRTDIDHGLRFEGNGTRFVGAADVGIQVDEPYDLHAVVERVMRNPDEWRIKREAALDLVYAYRHGAAERGARVLEKWARSLSKRP